MENEKIIISPLSTDESNHLRGGFGLISIKTEVAVNNKNQNCDQSASNGDTNINCRDCDCKSGGDDLQVNIICFIEKPAE